MIPTKIHLKNPEPLHAKINQIIDWCGDIEQKLIKHGVMQAEASDSAAVAAVGKRSVGTVTEGLEVTDIKTGQILNVEGYGFMFARVHTGEIQCFNIGNVSELPRGE